MTKAISTLRNSNYGASRQSIMDKYDTNGDGKIDLAELHAFVDDYIINITNNDTLLDRVSNLRRLIGFGTILLVIIALSNLGTAILAANISKETVIVNGRFVANDGSNAAISTATAVESVTKEALGRDPESRRNLAVDGAADGTASSLYVCLTQDEVVAISERSMNGSGTSLIIQQSGENDGSTSEILVPIKGTEYSNQTQVSYPASSVVINLDTSGLCEDSRRKLSYYEYDESVTVDMWVLGWNDYLDGECEDLQGDLSSLAWYLQTCVDGGKTFNECLPDEFQGDDLNDRVLCPYSPIGMYCDCTDDCNDYRESKCGCATAQNCCEQYRLETIGECDDGSVCAAGAPSTPDSSYCSLRGIDPGLGDTYCYLYAGSPENANLLATVVTASFDFDPYGVFLVTCLEDLVQALLLTQSRPDINRQVCEEDDKTAVAFFSTIESSSYPTNSLGWDVPMCKSDECDATVLQQVLTETFSDIFALSTTWNSEGWTATSTVTLTAECVYDKIGAAMNNPELYCTEDAPTCSNMKLVEITLADDAPFEVAICDDNECLASVGAVDITGYFARGEIQQSFVPQEAWKDENLMDPFCSKDLGNSLYRKYVSVKISDKAFDKTKYCTVAAASERAGMCPCSDSATYEFKVEFSGKMEKCSWMTKNPKAEKDAARIKKYCADTQTKFQCAKTCSNCRGCADDEGHTFFLPNVGKAVNCSYITKNRIATRKTKFCPLQGHACPKSCGYCPA